MPTPPADTGYVVPPRLWRWAGSRRAVVVFLWLVALGIGAFHLWHARTWFGNRAHYPPGLNRPDGNGGHAQIDFGGQWVMGRMIREGHGRELYHRQRQWQVVRAGFPVEREPPGVREDQFLAKSERRTFKPDEDVRHDADWMMHWFMGADPPEWKKLGGSVALPLADLSGSPLTAAVHLAVSESTFTPETAAKLTTPTIGGPLYPPVHGFFYAPLATDDPQLGYAILQCLLLAAAYLAALGISVLSGGRIWWSAASIAILMYPGCRTSIDLAQNPLISLAILVWGWVLVARDREFLGGCVWGLFAFKPVWALAFLLIPLLSRRWRMAAGMALTGGALAVATLPLVGLQTWFDWLAVGREGAALYDVNKNWVQLSRDLHGVPNRALLNFDLPESERRSPTARAIGWTLWGGVLLTTVVVYLRRGNRRLATGVGAAFLFLGAYHSCYRFMYYDVLLSAAAIGLLLADPRRFVSPRPIAVVPPDGRPRGTAYVNSFPLTVLVLLILVDAVLMGLKVEVTAGVGYFARPVPTVGGTALAAPKLSADTSLDYPWDGALIFALWAWCAWRLWRDGDEPQADGK